MLHSRNCYAALCSHAQLSFACHSDFMASKTRITWEEGQQGRGIAREEGQKRRRITWEPNSKGRGRSTFATVMLLPAPTLSFPLLFIASKAGRIITRETKWQGRKVSKGERNNMGGRSGKGGWRSTFVTVMLLFAPTPSFPLLCTHCQWLQ